ncbi:MAG: hypothetical protein OEX09_08475 [Candidatus Bathyarchaeota archaeon]|nr:hypothetical protein [Candidatus Bathyarchaeota archaeon]
MSNWKSLLTGSLMLILLMVFPMVPAQDTTEADLVGVEVGDWVKYDVSCEGDPHLWNIPLVYYSPEDVEWIEVEVLSVSEPNVTVRETIHRFDGEERNTTFTIDPAKTVMWPGDRYVIPANVSVGYKIPIDRDKYDPVTKSWKTVYELSINTTASRCYNGVTREVDMLKSSWMYPYFEYIENLTEVYVWDRATGFLLEKSWHTIFVELGNASLSTVSVKIIDTNMWKMEAAQPNWSQVLLGLLGAAVVVSAVVAASVLYKKRNKKTSPPSPK